MTIYLFCFFAGMLTVLAPCILPLLPVIIGGSMTDAHSRLKPIIIVVSLAVSVIVFTLALKVSTAFIDIPNQVWKIVSGGILVGFGLVTLFPTTWEKITVHFQPKKANALLSKGVQKKNWSGDVLIGASLGPVFASCSPTYFLILSVILLSDYSQGTKYLIAYTLGLAIVLLAIAYLGQSITKRLSGAANPHGVFKKTLGVLFILVGIAVLTGSDKWIEGRILDTNLYTPIQELDQSIVEEIKKRDPAESL